jgi:YceI-like domain
MAGFMRRDYRPGPVIGNAISKHHSGTLPLAAGEPSRWEASEIDRLQAGPSGRELREQPNQIHLRQGQFASARFTIDMASIACEDLLDPSLNAMLLAHHPTAQFVATAAEKIDPCTDGTPNHVLRGTFTLRGISHPLEFPVLLAATDDARRLTGQGVLELDRRFRIAAI